MLSFAFGRPDRGRAGLDWRIRIYRRLSAGDRPRAWGALFAVVVAGSLVLGAWRWWFRQPVFDDAYISIRYAQNWVVIKRPHPWRTSWSAA